MALATPTSSNDAALNEHLNITHDASIANLEQKSSEVQQQYLQEKAGLEYQKQRSAEVVQGTINAARENEALKAEADFRQAVENARAVENAVYQKLGSPPEGINYNRLTVCPWIYTRILSKLVNWFLKRETPISTPIPKKETTRICRCVSEKMAS
jgi:hypothetical protein